MPTADRVFNYTCPHRECGRTHAEYLNAWPRACQDCGCLGCYFCLTSCPGGDHYVCTSCERSHNIDHVFEGLADDGKGASYLYERLQDENPSDLLDRCFHEAARRFCPAGYPMHIRSHTQWDLITQCVNMGIDSHLEGFTRSIFNATTGRVLIHPDELHVLLRRMAEITDNTAHDGEACQDDSTACAGEGDCTVGTYEDLRRGIIGALGPKEE